MVNSMEFSRTDAQMAAKKQFLFISNTKVDQFQMFPFQKGEVKCYVLIETI